MKPNALPKSRMAEAEVSLRLAFYLLDLPGSDGVARVAIDGAQVKVGKRRVFPIVDFFRDTGWVQEEQIGSRGWQGRYVKDGQTLIIHSRPGVGDVVVGVGKKRIRAECKGGPLVKKPGSREYRKLREALGQAITVDQVHPNDVLMVAIPRTAAFSRLARRWRRAPLVAGAGIQIVLVGRDGMVEGLELS